MAGSDYRDHPLLRGLREQRTQDTGEPLPGAARVLLVDDEPAILKAIERALTTDGFAVEVATDGQQALDACAAWHPDVVLMDVNMPVLDGFETCRRLRADPATAELPVIMVTGTDDSGARLKALEVGADDLIAKPARMEELRARVRTIARLNRYRLLLSQRARLGWVTEHADVGYLVLGADDRILETNARARSYLDLPAELSRPSPAFLDWARRRYRLEPEAAWATWPAPGGPRRYLVRAETATAPAFWLELDELSPPRPDTTERFVRLRDISREVNALRVQWTFEAVIQHKLRTPLTSLLASLRLLERRTERAPTDALGAALRSIERLSHIIVDVLDYLDAPSLARAVGVRPTAAAVADLAAARAADLGLAAPEVTIAPGLADRRLDLPERAVDVVVLELFENARKFHPTKQPRITLALEDAGAERVALRVTNDGTTMSPEQLGRAFSPYYQGERDFTGQQPGMGLGLAVVATIVWTAGGRCAIANRDDGSGVQVTLTLPLAAAGPA